MVKKWRHWVKCCLFCVWLQLYRSRGIYNPQKLVFQGVRIKCLCSKTNRDTKYCLSSEIEVPQVENVEKIHGFVLNSLCKLHMRTSAKKRSLEAFFLAVSAPLDQSASKYSSWQLMHMRIDSPKGFTRFWVYIGENRQNRETTCSNQIQI